MWGVDYESGLFTSWAGGKKARWEKGPGGGRLFLLLRFGFCYAAADQPPFRGPITSH